MDHAPQSSIYGPAEASSPQDNVSESVNVEENSGATDSDKPNQPNVQVGSQSVTRTLCGRVIKPAVRFEL